MSESTFFRLVVGLLLSATGIHAYSCPIELSPPSVVVRYGASVSVNCSSSSTQLDGMGWEAAVGSIDMEENITSLTWTVERLTYWTISPSCFINLLPGSPEPLQCLVVLPVVIYKFPDNITISSTIGSAGLMYEGEEYHFTCDIRDIAPVQNLTVIWYKGNDIVYKNYSANNPSKEPVNVVSVYNFKPSRDDDGAQFRCEAHLNLGPVGPDLSLTSQEYPVIVHYPPSAMVELEDTEVEPGSAVWLNCSSRGNPRLTYSWNYYQAANVKVENKDGVSRLHIHNATGSNMGSYTCFAWNEGGKVNKTVMVTVKGAKPECPISITPERMVVQYQDRASAMCNPTSAISANLKEIYWQVAQDTIHGTQWSVNTHEDWDPKPVCTATFEGIGTCHKPFDFTMYKTPDVFIHSVNHTGPMVAGEEYQLQCDIIGVAPVQKLTVWWYRGNKTMTRKGPLHLTGCPPQDKTNCDINVTRTPVNVSSTINIMLGRNQNWAEFSCEAQLDLGPEGPQPPPTMISNPLNITVYSKPIINATKLPSKMPVFRGYPEELVCEAEGHPTPSIQWLYSSETAVRVSGDTLTISEAGVYTCSATNDVASSVLAVEVILKGWPVGASCPIELSPPSVVVKYGASVSVNCSTSTQHEGMGWEAAEGSIGLEENITFLTWTVERLTYWMISPKCYITVLGNQCLRTLPVTIYKMPNSVSISQSSHVGPMVEGTEYHMRCDIVDVAPANNLSVTWYKGNEIILAKSYDSLTETPVNESSSLTITPSRGDNGADIFCKAQLNLGPLGPNPSPLMTSKPHKMIVYYPPTLVRPETETLDLADANKVILSCMATGNPTPVYSWQTSHPVQEKMRNQAILSLTLQHPGTYNCTASNDLGTTTKHFIITKTSSNHGTTAGIVGAVLLVIVISLSCVVYHKQKNSSVARTQESGQMS